MDAGIEQINRNFPPSGSCLAEEQTEWYSPAVKQSMFKLDVWD